MLNKTALKKGKEHGRWLKRSTCASRGVSAREARWREASRREMGERAVGGRALKCRGEKAVRKCREENTFTQGRGGKGKRGEEDLADGGGGEG